jgi:hypothetical protein
MMAFIHQVGFRRYGSTFSTRPVPPPFPGTAPKLILR